MLSRELPMHNTFSIVSVVYIDSFSQVSSDRRQNRLFGWMKPKNQYEEMQRNACLTLHISASCTAKVFFVVVKKNINKQPIIITTKPHTKYTSVLCLWLYALSYKFNEHNSHFVIVKYTIILHFHSYQSFVIIAAITHLSDGPNGDVLSIKFQRCWTVYVCIWSGQDIYPIIIIIQ